MNRIAHCRHSASTISTAGTLLVLVLLLLSAGCSGGSHTEYAPPGNPWVGKRLTFEKPMVYMSNLPAFYSTNKELMRIGRELMRLDQAAHLVRAVRNMGSVEITPVPADATFEVVAVFTVVHDGYDRLFVSDYAVLVLKDRDGTLSTILTDAYLNYERERDAGRN